MVIAIPVATQTEPLVEAFVSLIESQGGLTEHIVRIVHTKDAKDTAAGFAARLAPHAKHTDLVPLQLDSPQLQNGLFYSVIHTLRQLTLPPTQVLWLEPGVLPSNAYSFDLLAGAFAQYPGAAAFTGRHADGNPEPTELVALNIAHLSRNPALVKIASSKDRTFRSLLTYVNSATVFLPSLTLGDGAALFTKASSDAVTKKTVTPRPPKTEAKVETADAAPAGTVSFPTKQD